MVKEVAEKTSKVAGDGTTTATIYAEAIFAEGLKNVASGANANQIQRGINNAVEKYMAALDEHSPDILGMSALLTTTMPYMKVVIDALVEKGVRQDYTVLVGGAPLNEAFANSIGADSYCRDAAVAVETAKQYMAKRQGSALAARG